MRILIVDDEKEIADLVRHCLEREGLEATVCTDGNEALGKIQSEEFDLAILDIMLPDSYDLKPLYELLTINKDARIVVNSAINKPEITREALLAGARGFITKPFNETDFLCKIKMALED